MHWYTAGVAFRTGMEDSLAISISLVALRASSTDGARSRAEELGRLLAAASEWEFEDVVDLYAVADEELHEGVELYSFFADRTLLAAIREQAARGIRG